MKKLVRIKFEEKIYFVRSYEKKYEENFQ